MDCRTDKPACSQGVTAAVPFFWDTTFVSVAMALGVGWSVHGVLSARQLREGLADAERHFEAGRHATARQRLLELAARWPNQGEVLFRLGLSEQARGDSKAALDAWSRVPTRSDWFPRAAANRGNLLINTGRYARAEELLETARSLAQADPARYEVERALIRLYRFQGRTNDVRRLLRASLVRAPDPPAVLRELWLLDTSPFPVEAWQKALEAADPDDDRVWLGQAHVAILTGRYCDAARWLDDCLQRRPEDPAVWRAQLELARAIEDLPAVWEALDHLPAQTWSASEVLELRAWLLAQRGDLEGERRTLEWLVEQTPGQFAAWDRLVTIALEQGQPERISALRQRQGEIDRAKDRFRKLLLDSDDLNASAPEFAQLAEVLGRRFDARAWLALAREKPIPEDLEPQRPPTQIRSTLAQVLDLPRFDHAQTARQAPTPESIPPDFEEIAEAAGLSFVFDNGATPLRQLPETMSGGVGVLDFDGDGWLDVYVVQGGPIRADAPRSGDRLFRNTGDGTFEDVTESSGIASLPQGYGMGVTVGDFDNDGHPDLFLTRLQSYALFRNRGDGTFEDVTESVGLGGYQHNPTSAAFADLNHNGYLDLFVCHYMQWDEDNPQLCLNENGEYFYCDPSKVEHARNRVFRNDGGRFIEVTDEAGFVDPDGRSLGVVAADFDGDGLIDLYVANDGTANYLFRNLGDFRFEEVGVASGVAGNAEGGFQAGMGVACGDLDGDGLPELLVTNFYGEATTLYRNLGGGLFHDWTSPTGLRAASRHLLGFGLALLDYDNDGDLDMMSVNGHVNDNRPFYPYAMPTQLLANSGDGTLIDVSSPAGLPWTTPRVGRGLAVGDLDNDGCVDALILSQNEPLAYFRNRTDGGHFLTLRLEGTASNRDGVGALVILEANGRRQVTQHLGGGSYQSASDARLHFGLGPASLVDSVEVRWPSGQVDRFHDLNVNTGYLLREGDSTPQPLVGFSP